MLIYCIKCSVALFPVDEPASASIVTDDHAKDLCASELRSAVDIFIYLQYFKNIRTNPAQLIMALTINTNH